MMNNLSYFWRKKTILSFIAVLFVVIIHNSATGQYELTQDFFTNLTTLFRNLFAYGFGSIAVPLFFFLSGFTMFRNYRLKDYPKKLKSRAKSLLLPYLLWNMFSLLFVILTTYTPLSGLISGREPFSLSTTNIIDGIFFYKYNFQFWFLYDLIIYTVLSPIIYFLIRNKFIGILSIILCFLLPIFVGSILKLDINFTIFYLLGCYFGKNNLSFFTKKSSKNLIVSSGIVFFVLITIKVLSLYKIIILPLPLYQLILIILLISFWFFSDSFINAIKPKKYHQEFFSIYTIHTYILAAIVKIIYVIGPKTSYMLFVNETLGSLIAILLVIFISYFWHKKLPKTYNFMFGIKPTRE